MTRPPWGWRQWCPQLLTAVAVAAFLIPLVLTHGS
jgi:hypothetical protein